jgi:hypothetical protein
MNAKEKPCPSDEGQGLTRWESLTSSPISIYGYYLPTVEFFG